MIPNEHTVYDGFFYNIDLTKKPLKPKLKLCKPDLHRTAVGNLKEAFNIRFKPRLGSLNELYFSIPYEIEKDNALTKNTNISKVKNRFIVKFTLGNYQEYFLITKIFDKSENDQDIKQIECLSLGRELANKTITHSVVSYNLTSVMVDLLSTSIWNIGYVDASFDLMYRALDFNGTVLEGVIEVAEAFGALIVWDTDNRAINFYKPENIGQNRGFKLKYGKLLQSISQESNSDELCTRLKIAGKDGLSIYEINPAGTNYIQDFSYFLYPFQRDNNRSVISHSEYMSDGLCHAILDYNELVENNKVQFQSLLNSLKSLREQLTTRNNELFLLETELAVIEDQIATANATNTGNLSQLISQKNSKQTQINNKSNEIQTLQTQINNTNTSIQSLRSQLSMESNFTSDQLVELNQFIIEREWSSNHYTDAQELLDAATIEFDKIRVPKLVVTLDMQNLFECIEESHNWDKVNLGNS